MNIQMLHYILVAGNRFRGTYIRYPLVLVHVLISCFESKAGLGTSPRGWLPMNIIN